MRSTRLSRVASFTAALAAAAALFGPATSAQAAEECGARTTTKAFAGFGDTNEYFPLTGGTFESGDLSAFKVTGGPWIVGENEPWRVLGGSHARSVALPPGATLTASFCLQIGEDSLRAFVKAPSVPGASLQMKSKVTTTYGTASASISTTGGSGSWNPTARLPLYNVASSDGRQYITVVVTNAGAGTWLLDDLLVDPWKTR